MRIDEESSSQSGASTSDMPVLSAELIGQLRAATSRDVFVEALNRAKQLQSVMGKTDLGRWAWVLNEIDGILEEGIQSDDGQQGVGKPMRVDTSAIHKAHIIACLRFTGLLFECTSSRRVYASIDRILALMEVEDLEVLIEVLRLLQIMGKRSKFLTQRLCPNDQSTLVQNLTAIAQCWGGRLRSVRMADCVGEAPPPAATAPQQLFPFNFIDNKGRSILIQHLKKNERLAMTVHAYREKYELGPNDFYCLLARLRMQTHFDRPQHRVNSVIARLLSISTLIYCRCQTDETNVSSLLYAGFIEEVIALLKCEWPTQPLIMDAIQTEALCTLCAIVSLEKEPKISQILESLSAGSYHGFLAVMTRNVVDELKRNELGKPGHSSVALATALFSFLYHLGSVEPGGETLVGCGLTQILVGVIAHHTVPLELITFATRCSRIIDLFTTIDVTAFRNANGMEICVNRIVHEVNECRKEEPFVIDTVVDVEPKEDEEPPVGKVVKGSSNSLTCHQQRCGLIKGLVTFVKRAIQDAQFQDSIRHIMEGDLPEALIHILSNSDYYSSSLFHQTIQLITNFIYQEPGQLTLLQNKHIPFVMLQCLLRKELPTSRDVITHLANVFTALCLNERGLKQFKAYEPFEHFFNIIISTKFLTTMKKRRSEMTDAAQNVGTALDDLLRHQPTLRQPMLNAIIKVLDRLLALSQRSHPNAEIVMQLAKSHSRNSGASQSSTSGAATGTAGNAAVATTGSGQGDDTPPQLAPGQAETFAGARQMQRVVMEVLDETFGIVLSPRDGEEMSDVDDEAEMEEMGSEDMPTGNAAGNVHKEQEKESDDEIMGLDVVYFPTESRTNGIIPLGDYMLIIAKILETLTATNGPGVVEFVEGLVERGAVRKLLQLCQLPNFSHELAQQGQFPASVASIIKHMIFHRNNRSTERLMEEIFSSFITTISPLLATPPPEGGGVSLLCHLGEKTISDSLTNLDNILPILSSITRNSLQMPPEMRNRLWEAWLGKSGDKLLNGLRKVARTLNWEYSLIRQLKPSSRTLATQTDPSEMQMHDESTGTGNQGMETESCASTAAAEMMMVDNVTSVAAERTQSGDTTRPATWVSAGVSEEENEFWTRNKNIAELINKSSRNVDEVLNTLARSCFSPSQRRQRRYDAMAQLVSPSAQRIATSIFNAIYRDFKWQHPTGRAMRTEDSRKDNIIECGRLSALIVQLSMTMFDEREKIQPATLLAFYQSGCHEAFCQLVNDDLLNALTATTTQQGTGNLLNSEGSTINLLTQWCHLAGRLISKANVNVAAKAPDFDLNKYLKLLNTDLFTSFTRLFKVLSREDIDLSQYELLCDLCMEVYKEVVASLMPSEEEKTKAKEDGSSAGGRQSPVSSEEDIQRLVDMGFDRGMAERALRDSGGNPAEAAEYLLTLTGEPAFMNRNDIAQALEARAQRDLPESQIARALDRAIAGLGAGRDSGPRIPRNREEAIALLEAFEAATEGRAAQGQPPAASAEGEQPQEPPQRPTSPNSGNNDSAPGSSGISVTTGDATSQTDKDKSSSSTAATQSQPKSNDDFLYDKDIPKAQVIPLKDVVIDSSMSVSRACLALLPLCKRLMEFGSADLVFSCADLVISLTKSVHAEWRNSELIDNILYREIVCMADELMSAAGSNAAGLEDKRITCLGTRVHFACLLFDHIAKDYIEKINDTGFVGKLIDLIAWVYEHFERPGIQRELLSPLVLWLDLYDKNTRAERRLALLREVANDKLQWSYLSDEAYGGRNKRWQTFNATQQSQLNSAFFAGKDVCVLKAGGTYRRERESDITVDFASMRQTRSAITANGNPAPSGSSPVNVEIPVPTLAASQQNGQTENAPSSSTATPPPAIVDLSRIVTEEAESVWPRDTSARLIHLLSRILHKSHIHHTAAHSLLSFIARLTRHSDHASDFLQQGGIAAIIQLQCASSPSTIKLTSIIMRHCLDDENLLSQVFEKCVRACASVPHTASFLTDYLGVAPNRPKEWHETLYKLAPLAIRNPSVFVSVMERCVRMEQSGGGSAAGNNGMVTFNVQGKQTHTAAAAANSSTQAQQHIPPACNERTTEIVNLLLHEAVHGEWESSTSGTNATNSCPFSAPSPNFTGNGHSTRMLSRSDILLLLAELTKSYPCVAGIICDTRDNGQSVMQLLIEKFTQCNADAQIRPFGYPKMTGALKTLVSVLAQSNHSPKAQESLVSDVKAVVVSLAAGICHLDVPTNESTSGSTQDPQAISEMIGKRLTELCSLIVTMCECCEAPLPSPAAQRRGVPATPQSHNPIVKLFHKKRIANDLIRTITNLRLNNKDTIESVHQILKTLDSLMKNVGQTAGGATGHATGERGERRIEIGVTTQVMGGNGEAMQDDHQPDESAVRAADARIEIDLGPARHLRDDDLEDDEEMHEERLHLESSSSSSMDSDGERDDEEEDDLDRTQGDGDEAMEEDDVEDSMSSDEEHDDDDHHPQAEAEDRQARVGEDVNADGHRDAEGDGDEERHSDEDEQDDHVREDEESRDRHNETLREEEEEEDSGDDGEGEEDDDEHEDYDDIYDDEAYDEEMQHHMDQHGAVAFLENVITHHGVGPAHIGTIGGGFHVLDHRHALHDDWHIFGGPLVQRHALRGQRDPPPAVHPLLVRPQQLVNAHGPTGIGGVATGHLPLGVNPHQHGVYRFIAHTANHPANLTRQNAIRRIGGGTAGGRLRPIGGGHFFDQLFELGITGRHRPLINVLDSALTESPEERRLRQPTAVQSALDRLAEEVAVIDPLSANYIHILIAHIVTQVARNKMKEEKEKAEKERREAQAAIAAAQKEASKSKEGAAKTEDTPAEVREAASSSEQAERAESQAREETSGGESTGAGEPMEVGETAVEGSNEAEDVSMDEAPAPASTAATVASSIAGEDVDEQMRSPQDETPGTQSVPVTAGGIEIQSAAVTEEQAAEQPAQTDQPGSSGQAHEDYSAILGDIGQLPEGVDPAFLAALPEDMRNEVLRDYRAQQERQRRAAAAAQAQQTAQAAANQSAQQATAPNVSTTSNAGEAPTDSTQSGADNATASSSASAQPPAPTVSAIEPIDQEFLAALPPELQEEILMQHERAVREAEEAARRANAPAVPPEPEMDGAAVIASLPANERAVVLAEMDDTELQRLPQNMQDEARRARTNMAHYDNNLLRMIVGGGRNGGIHLGGGRERGRVSQYAGPSIGQQAGQTNIASGQAPQILDRDSCITLCMLLLVDRLNMQKVQKVLRAACVNAQTCDFVIYALMSLLDKASEAVEEEEEMASLMPAWLESITVSGVGHNEKAIKINRHGKVSIHSLLSVGVCRNILETLASIAKAYPGHFLPAVLRREGQAEATVSKQPLHVDQFWQMVQTMSTKQAMQKDWPAGTSPLKEMEASPVMRLFDFFDKPVVRSNAQLTDRLIKCINTVVQTFPTNTTERLGIPDDQVAFTAQLEKIIQVVTRGCSASTQSNNNSGGGGMAGLGNMGGVYDSGTPGSSSDSLTLLAELMRSFNQPTSKHMYDLLFAEIVNVGLQLQPQIERLVKELDECVETPMEVEKVDEEAGERADKPGTSRSDTGRDRDAEETTRDRDQAMNRRHMRGRFDGNQVIIDGEENSRLMIGASSCKELQLPAVTALTDKSGAQYKLLNALHTLVKVRDTIHALNEKRRKDKEDERRRQETLDREAAENARKETEAQSAQAADSGEASSGAGQVRQAEQQETTTTASSVQTSEQPAASAEQTGKLEEKKEEKAETIKKEEQEPEVKERLSERLVQLEGLWECLSECLSRLGRASDPHAVLALQPAAEAFFLVHAVTQDKEKKQQQQQPAAVTPAPSTDEERKEDGVKKDEQHMQEMDPDTVKLLAFAEKHRQVLNQALRQNHHVLSAGGPFAILVKYPKLLDFDVKRKYFRRELGKLETSYRRNDISVQVRRSQVFADSFRGLYRIKPADWKNRFYVIFQGEEGQDAGGLLREWFSVITREIFNPGYALFVTSSDGTTYMINKSSYVNPEHLDYFKFVGRIIAKAVFEHKYLDCFFTRAFYKHILNLPVRYQDLESEDPAFYKSLEFILENEIQDLGLDLTFSTDVEEFGVLSVRDLKENGRNLPVNDSNKEEYVRLVCQMKMTGSIRKQLDAFLEGFYSIIPKSLISLFNEQELELLISGLPTIDVDDLQANTDYKGFTKSSPQIQWFWRAVRSMEASDKAKLLQFVTGTSKVPLQGFASLEGMNGVQKFSIHADSRGGDRLPAAHTCFNQLDLPMYDSFEKLRDMLLLAVRECSEGFGFA